MSGMTIDSSNLIQKINLLSAEAANNNVSPNLAQKTDSSFKTYLNEAVDSVNQDQLKSHELKKAYINEDSSVSLSKVMIQMQKAEVSLSALVTVRNKMLEGYKTLMNMAI